MAPEPGADAAKAPRASGPLLRFGDCDFDPATGELRRLDGAASTSLPRLGPQPAALLTLLIERRGAVATREQIRERIWPEIQVDFDASLHHCVRQIRAALGESAREPVYIETIPRRGYRLVCAVEAGEVEDRRAPRAGASIEDEAREDDAGEDRRAPRASAAIAARDDEDDDGEDESVEDRRAPRAGASAIEDEAREDESVEDRRAPRAGASAIEGEAREDESVEDRRAPRAGASAIEGEAREEESVEDRRAPRAGASAVEDEAHDDNDDDGEEESVEDRRASRAGASAVEDDTRDDNDDDGEDESVEDRRASRAVAPPVPVRPGRRSWLTSLVLVAAGFAVTRLVASTRRRALRVALLPFADDATPPAIAGPATAIGERVLEGLTTATRGVADIVGPRTTGPQRQRSPELRALARELDASYVLNAKHLDEPAPTMLVELIRVADGKHVWVRRYAQLRETATIAADIVAGASETLRVEAEAGA